MKCADCQKADSLSLCNHCNEKVCVECRVEHSTLSSEIGMNLTTWKESLMSDSYKTKLRAKDISLEERLQQLRLERKRMKQMFDRETQRLMENLTKRRRYFDQYFSMVISIYKGLNTDETEEVPSFVTDLSGKLLQCKTRKSLHQLKNHLSDLKTATRLVETRDDEFKFVCESTLDVETFGRVEFGQAVVGIHGAYDDVPGADECIQFDRSGFSFNADKSGQKIMKNVETWTDFSSELSEARGSVSVVNEPATMTDASTLTEERYTSLPGPVSAADLSRDPLQNQLPKNVDYKMKGPGHVVVIGQDNPDSGMRLSYPMNCAYHVTRDELFVADSGNDRIMVYNTHGGNGRVFYTIDEPRYVTISDAGEHIYILHYNKYSFSPSSNSTLQKVSINGQRGRTIDSFPLGKLENCYSLVFHNGHVAVLSDHHKCVVIYTESCEYVRHFCLENIHGVMSMAVDGLGNFYIPDTKTGSVHVYTWQGQFTAKFGELDTDGYSEGICVDGDGVVCVSRWTQYCKKHRIDVYDPQRRHLTLGKEGKAAGEFSHPRGLCLLPDGRLVVADSWNHRLQIF